MTAPGRFQTRLLQPHEAEAHRRLMNQAFRPSLRESLIAWSSFDVLADGDHLCATLARSSATQWFAGRPCPTVLISGVATDPARRGEGLARRLISDVLAEAKASGHAAAVLYPSATRLYHHLGFGFAGERWTYAAPCKAFRSLGAPARARTLETEDWPALIAAQEEWSRQQNGVIARSPERWPQILAGREGVVFGDSRIEGYLLLDPTPGPDLIVHDHFLATAAATAAAAQTLASFAAIREQVVWYGGRDDALLIAAGPNAAMMRRGNLVFPYWMLRVLDVSRALSSRGYDGAEGEVWIDHTDDLFPDNFGMIRLHVKGGIADVTRISGRPATPGAATITTTGSGLAALLTGYRSPAALSAAGDVAGSAEALVTAGRLLHASAPWTTDHI